VRDDNRDDLRMATASPIELLEREEALAVLEGAFERAAAGRGALVLVGGEAGVGKSALVRAFCEGRRAEVRILSGACDPLFTPRPLGPFVEIAEQLGSPFADAVADGGPHQVARTLVAACSASGGIVAIEDLHWADEASLDVLRLLARRVEEAPLLVVATYRDDELDQAHPLRIVLGQLASSRTLRRVAVEPLSPDGVSTLAAPFAVDGDELYRKTGGNPFFVTEALAASTDEIPQTVRDAVLARLARLGAAERALVEASAVPRPHAELWLLEALVDGALDPLERCLASGVLTATENGVGFRHELARLAVEDSLPPDRRRALHRAALAALASAPTPDLDRLAHHADAAGDAEAVLRYAPPAAERAAARGAHREAAAHYARALRFADRVAPLELASLALRRSKECYVTDQQDEAIAEAQRAIECYRAIGDRRREGKAFCWLSDILWCPGRTAEAAEAAHVAVALLEEHPPTRDLAVAYGNVATVRMEAEDLEGTLTWGNRALELGRELQDDAILCHELQTMGSIEFLNGRADGREKLERSLELARELESEDLIGRASMHLAKAAVRQRMHSYANRYIDAGLAYFAERGHLLWRLYLLAHRSQIELQQGRWDDAARTADLILRERWISTLPRTIALTVLALVRARRGDPGYRPLLDAALELAEGRGEPQRIAPVAAARAEVAWIEGRPGLVAEETEAAFALAVERRSPWFVGELATWRRRAGADFQTDVAVAAPYAALVAGDHARAAELWEELGCPYDAALARADASDEASLRLAHERLLALGAKPAAAIVARRLRALGARRVPRGPRRSTRSNAGQLTTRELEVLALIADGLRNAEAAERLVISTRTIDHHVSSLLGKLGARTRGEAVVAARRLGVLDGPL
jgi:DNA-binding NarL/FixJ family response regulator/tetratricopeptide (TPR) repeat protein